MPLKTSLAAITGAFGDVLGRLRAGRQDKGPIDTVDRLLRFVETRSAMVAQASLYGYLKARMGTSYVSLFQDDVYVASINQAKWPIFTSCLSDMCVFASAVIGQDAGWPDDEMASLATHAFNTALKEACEPSIYTQLAATATSLHQHRVASADWAAARSGETAFLQSPADLIVHAPVIDSYKELDAGIVRNSMRFRWTEVRRDFRKRLAPAAVANEWQIRKHAAPDHPAEPTQPE